MMVRVQLHPTAPALFVFLVVFVQPIIIFLYIICSVSKRALKNPPWWTVGMTVSACSYPTVFLVVVCFLHLFVMVTTFTAISVRQRDLFGYFLM